MDRLKRFSKFSLIVSIGFSVSMLVAGCTLVQVVPVQLARISQMEAYTQTFDIEINIPNTSTISDNEKQDLQVTELDGVLTDLLGPTNWQNLKDLYGSAKLVTAFLKKRIVMKGHIINTLYLDPITHDRVLFEGFGRFFIINEDTGRILLSGDARIIPEYYNLSSFRAGEIKLNIMFYITRIPKRSTNYHQATVEYHVKFNNKFKNKDVYSIDYTTSHDMYLRRPLNRVGNKMQKIGSLYFERKHAGAKLIDFNGLEVIKSNYIDMVREFEKPRETGSQGEQYE